MLRMMLMIGLSVCLMGCSLIKGDDGYFRNRARDYHGAKLVEPLRVPSDLVMPEHSDLYPVEIATNHDPVPLEPPNFTEGVDS